VELHANWITSSPRNWTLSVLHLAPTVSDMSTMTQTLAPVRAARHDGPASRPRLVTGRFAAALVASFGALTSFYLLLSVTPMYAVSAGAGSPGGVRPDRAADPHRPAARRPRRNLFVVR